MTSDTLFTEQIRAAYPAGLTGIFAVGGTRTTYILEEQRNSADPGNIKDFQDYSRHAKTKYMNLILNFIELGGHNIIIPTLAYQRFTEYGDEYLQFIAQYSLELIDDEMCEFYDKNRIDPYFIGIDTLLKLPETNPGYNLGYRYAEFASSHIYTEGNYKLIWEIAPIPLFSFFNAKKILAKDVWAELENEIESVDDLQSVHDMMYRHYSRAVYGTDIPYPNFYVGSNRNGDLKLRSMLPISLLCGGDFRLYFLPYPSLFMTRETLKTIIDDLTFGQRMSSSEKDYSGRYDAALVQSEYDRMMSLASDPLSTIGLSRQNSTHSDK